MARSAIPTADSVSFPRTSTVEAVTAENARTAAA